MAATACAVLLFIGMTILATFLPTGSENQPLHVTPAPSAAPHASMAANTANSASGKPAQAGDADARIKLDEETPPDPPPNADNAASTSR